MRGERRFNTMAKYFVIDFGFGTQEDNLRYNKSGVKKENNIFYDVTTRNAGSSRSFNMFDREHKEEKSKDFDFMDHTSARQGNNHKDNAPLCTTWRDSGNCPFTSWGCPRRHYYVDSDTPEVTVANVVKNEPVDDDGYLTGVSCTWETSTKSVEIMDFERGTTVPEITINEYPVYDLSEAQFVKSGTQSMSGGHSAAPSRTRKERVCSKLAADIWGRF